MVKKYKRRLFKNLGLFYRPTKIVVDSQSTTSQCFCRDISPNARYRDWVEVYVRRGAFIQAIGWEKGYFIDLLERVK